MKFYGNLLCVITGLILGVSSLELGTNGGYKIKVGVSYVPNTPDNITNYVENIKVSYFERMTHYLII